MSKLTASITTLTVVLACYGLWILCAVFQNIYEHALPKTALPELTYQCLSLRSYLLATPLPFIVICFILVIRRPTTFEVVLLFHSIAVLVLVFLAVLYAIGFALPWFHIKMILG